jgi:hypothetical protein
MVTSYATSADLATWTGTAAPTNVVPLLRSASIVIRDATLFAFYAVDGTGTPTDATTLQAFKDATCAQAAAMIALGIDPLAGGVYESSIESLVRIGSGEIRYGDDAVAAAAKERALASMVPEAKLLLQQAGINLYAVWVTG